MNLKQTALTAALATTMAMASGQAAAYVYGAAGLTIDNLSINISPFAAASGFSFAFNQSNLATLNGSAPAASSASCNGTPGAPGPGTNNCTATNLNAVAVNAPGSTILRTDNQTTGGEFSFLGPLNGFTGDFANADTQIVTAELVNIGSPTLTHNVAESLLNTGTDAASNSQIQSRTSFTLNFTVVGGPATFTLAFDADPDLLAAIFGEPGGGGAQANLTTSFTLTQNTGGTGSASWSPQGTAFNDCNASGGITCVETADTQDLNVNVGTATNNTQDPSSWDPNVLNLTHFGITASGLSAGNYTLVLSDSKSNQLSRVAAVPEPGVLALLGVGLVGAFATTRRRRKTA